MSSSPVTRAPKVDSASGCLVLDPQRERGRRLAGELFDADLGAANTIQTHRIDPTASVLDTAVGDRRRFEMRLAQDRPAQLRVTPQRGKAEVDEPAWRLVERDWSERRKALRDEAEPERCEDRGEQKR